MSIRLRRMSVPWSQCNPGRLTRIALSWTRPSSWTTPLQSPEMATGRRRRKVDAPAEEQEETEEKKRIENSFLGQLGGLKIRNVEKQEGGTDRTFRNFRTSETANFRILRQRKALIAGF